MAKQPSHLYQLKVTLNGTRPPVWRRILVPGDTTLRQLHDILQIVMGWTDSHLHQFISNGAYYGATEYDEGGELEMLPEQRYRLSQIAPEPGARFVYAYDFGDGWDHAVVVEKIVSPEPGARYPRCVAGKRACPPEDVGGVWGYEAFLKAIRNRRHPEHHEYLEWVGGQFDPEAFDLEQVNAQLRGMGRGRSAEVGNTWAMIESALDKEELNLDSAWARTLSASDQATAEYLPLRRDMLALLAYLCDEPITGTQATGNLPLKAVRAICAQFVEPPKLEDTIGDKVYPVRNETEVWPLYFRHVLAAVAGLVTGGPARRWRLTERGEQFLAAPAASQVWLVFTTWWTRVNWVMAFPWAYGDGQLPYGFTALVLQRLLALPASDRVLFEPFADQLIQAAPLVWPIENQDTARDILRGLVRTVVIGPLCDFGVLAAERVPNPVLGPGYQKLAAFRLTPFGKGILAAIVKTADLL
jgi:pRiA4b ORF-3-like protein